MMAFLHAFYVFGDGFSATKTKTGTGFRKQWKHIMVTTDVRLVEQELISDSTHIRAACTNWDIRDTYHVDMLMETDLAPQTQLNHTLQKLL